MAAEKTHAELAAELRQRLETTGVIGAGLRTGAMHAGAGEPAELAEPYGSVARDIGAASYRVTAAQIDAVREVAGSDRAAFEVVMSASVGAGLHRWDAAMRAIREATDAPE
ncbi:MAG TPA: hypothetical protein VJR25_07640 [Microbacterium sp.]|uniref:hypothetical protein n=1 Tax=Microbacterium sp. TaxID=51671 RepID=UPI002B49F9B1|nr:hypothetical protein [Microbacterium sp.]HKT56628.1 hypothetical protein [Microbacterium sp.]